eukprot:gb/GEZN01009486.1/.p1 GENE.gb/GEZN01009486.1/~~gb/GEZN01009486.1/.p1  ORF type:complete len:362 (-),score=47.58 gb/GEZN01009486.1/:149-1234(-)
MGQLCVSGHQKEWEAIRQAEKENDRKLENMMDKDDKAADMVKKLLLLGAGESGKSTIFKQMKGIYGGGWSEKDCTPYTATVYSNVVTSIQTLITMSVELKKYSAEGTDVSPHLLQACQAIQSLEDSAEIDEHIAKLIHDVWWDEGIQKTWVYRSMYYLTDSAGFFLDKILDIGRRGYIPTEQDVLRCRIRTTGIQEKEFEIGNTHFKIYDVGGQRNERKKWIHCFSGVHAVLFVAALSGYDMVLYEDQDTNRMHEALDLFDEICNSRYFRKTAMVLFLNKRDLFYEKIVHVPLTECFPDYTGAERDYDAAVNYIKDRFLDKSQFKQTITVHITCATEKNNVMKVFVAVKAAVLQQSLDEWQ